MKQIPLRGKAGAGKFAIVDDKDYPRLSKYLWYFDGNYAATFRCSYGRVRSWRMHVMLIPEAGGLVRDHINRNKLDNRRSNLRLVTQGENVRNGRASGQRPFSQNPDGNTYRGIRWKKKDRQWESRITYKGKQVYLGQFNKPRHAAIVYDLWSDYLYGKDATTNFPIAVSE